MVLAAAVTALAAGALAGCGSRLARSGAPTPPARALVVVRTSGPAPGIDRTPGPAPGRDRTPGPAPGVAPARRPAPPKPTWLINPDVPLPHRSPWWRVLAVARRFAAADMSYEVAEVGPAVRAAILGTCTAAFAAELFAHRAVLPPGVTARQVRQRLVGARPIERLPGSALVVANVVSVAHGGGAGALELWLVPRAGGWRVAAMSVA